MSDLDDPDLLAFLEDAESAWLAIYEPVRREQPPPPEDEDSQ